MRLVIYGLIFLTVAFFVFGFYRNWRTQNSPNEKIFLAGKIPKDLLDGFYKGKVAGLKTNWQGKVFHSKLQKGANIFGTGVKKQEVFPFKTYVGKGIADKNLDVVKIDYNIPQNPLWLRSILDEVVETSKNHFLGKLNIRIFPGLSFAMGYFTLTQ